MEIETKMFKLGNIYVEKQDRAAQEPLLYCRADQVFKAQEDTSIIKFFGGGTFDFTTYINAISSNKWKKYTIVDNFHLHLEIEGASGEVCLTFADQWDRFTQYFEGEIFKFEACGGTAVLDLKYPENSADMLAFEVRADGECTIKNSYYYTDVDETRLRDVKLSLCTTTFKKEDYILSNVADLYEQIFCSDSEMKDNFWIHVVDNGRTLKEEQMPECDHLFLHPNDNVGGAGGFARGMIESMDQSEGITHVLLMDDDVSVSPESIKKTYTLLRCVNDEYSEALVSGAMLDLDYPLEQWEDAGRIDEVGHFLQAKEPLRVTEVRACVKNERFDLEKAKYAAWWYCVIPVATIKRVGLPLPFFVRSDDTEYGFRCNSKIMTMNGIGIWHMGFRVRYDAAVERYQTTRNTLMANAFTGCSQQEFFLTQAKDGFKVEIKKFNYENALLVVEALEDFLEGPEFIMEKGKAEEMFLQKHKTCEQLKPIEEALQEVPEDKRSAVIEALNITDVYIEGRRELKQRVFDVASWNGQTLTGDAGIPDRDWVVVPYEGWYYMPEKQSGAKNIFVVDFYAKKACVRHRDKEKFKELKARFDRAMKKIKGNEELIERYRKAAPYVTSEEFWRSYLSLV